MLRVLAEDKAQQELGVHGTSQPQVQSQVLRMPKLQGRRESIGIQVSSNAYKKEHGSIFLPGSIFSVQRHKLRQARGVQWWKKQAQPTTDDQPESPAGSPACFTPASGHPTSQGAKAPSSDFLQADINSVSLPKNLFLIKRQKSVPNKIFTAQYTHLVTSGCAWESGPIHTFPIMLILKHASTHFL